VLSYDLPLITIHISDCRQFSDIHVSQGSVAAYFRRGGICFRCREPHGDSTLDHCFSPGPRLPSQLQGVTAVNRYQCRHSSVNRDMCEQLCMAVERSGLLPTTCRSFVKWPTYRGISSHYLSCSVWYVTRCLTVRRAHRCALQKRMNWSRSVFHSCQSKEKPNQELIRCAARWSHLANTTEWPLGRRRCGLWLALRQQLVGSCHYNSEVVKWRKVKYIRV